MSVVSPEAWFLWPVRLPTVSFAPVEQTLCLCCSASVRTTAVCLGGLGVGMTLWTCGSGPIVPGWPMPTAPVDPVRSGGHSCSFPLVAGFRTWNCNEPWGNCGPNGSTRLRLDPGIYHLCGCCLFPLAGATLGGLTRPRFGHLGVVYRVCGNVASGPSDRSFKVLGNWVWVPHGGWISGLCSFWGLPPGSVVCGPGLWFGVACRPRAWGPGGPPMGSLGAGCVRKV